jgi:hypothetical protein
MAFLCRSHSLRSRLHWPRLPVPRWPGPPLCAMLCLLALAACVPTASAQRLDKFVKNRVQFNSGFHCSLRPLGVELGYDLRLHHRVTVSLDEDALKGTMILRVRSYARALQDDQRRRFERPMPVMESVQVMASDQVSNPFGIIRLWWTFPTGPGLYEFVMAIDNGNGRGCVKRWTSRARAPKQEPRGGLQLSTGEIGERSMQIDGPQRKVEKRPDGIRACVLLNVENRYRDDLMIDWQSAEVAVGSIRLLAEDSLVREVAVTAFSLMQQELFYEQDFQESVDFLALTDAYERIEMGRIDFKNLGFEKEFAYFRQVISQRRSCLENSDLVLIVSPWWRESLPHRDAVLEMLSPHAGQTLAYMRPGWFRPRSRHENTMKSWRLDDALRGSVLKAGGRIMYRGTPYELVDDLHALAEQALKARDEASAGD